MLAQRRRRCADVVQILYKCLVFVCLMGDDECTTVHQKSSYIIYNLSIIINSIRGLTVFNFRMFVFKLFQTVNFLFIIKIV